MDYVTVYHVAAADDVASIKQGIDPGPNVGTQYGKGFYTFRNRGDAERWQQVKATLVEVSTVILELRLSREKWDGMHKRDVPRELDWRVPDEWLEAYNVLEGRWAPTPDTEAMAGAWQVKFNPNSYHLLNEVRVHSEEEVEA
jgi:hypothetical protein